MPYADEMAQIQRRRMLAQALIQQGAQPQGQQAGRFFVAPNALSTLSSLGAIVGGAALDRRGQKQEKAANDTERKRLADALRGLSGPSGASEASPPDPRREAALSVLSGLPVDQMQGVVGQQAAANLFQKPKELKSIDLGNEIGFADEAGNIVRRSPKGAAPQGAPNSAREYEFARQDGFKGSFQDWVTAGGQSSRPSSVQEWDFYTKLPPEMQSRYLEMKRNPNMVVKEVAGVPTVVAPSVGGTKTTALSTLPSEASAAGVIKQAEASGGALGKAEGEIAGGIKTKGSNAVSTQGTLDIAEPLIDLATGSTAGAAVDAVGKFFGKATSGAEAIAQLKVLQAGLMTTMPRMEGPQSDRDVMLYREAAGQIGDPTVPAPLKKAAVKTIRQIQQKYIERAQGGNTSGKPTFATEAEAEAAGLAPGTKVVIGGVSGTWK